MEIMMKISLGVKGVIRVCFNDMELAAGHEIENDIQSFTNCGDSRMKKQGTQAAKNILGRSRNES